MDTSSPSRPLLNLLSKQEDKPETNNNRSAAANADSETTCNNSNNDEEEIADSADTTTTSSEEHQFPGAVKVPGVDAENYDCDNTIVVGDDHDAIIEAQVVDESERERLAERVHQLERQAQVLQRQSVVADVVRSADVAIPEIDPEAAQDTTPELEEKEDEDYYNRNVLSLMQKLTPRVWIVSTLLLMTVFIVILATVLARKKENDTGGGDKRENFQELVSLFSDRNPDTAKAMTNTSSDQYRAMEWLAVDTQRNSWRPPLDERRIVQRGSLAIFFYSALGDTGRWDNDTGWLDHDLSECNWYEVICNKDGVVIELDFNDDNLAGTIPRELGFVDGMLELDLGSNAMGGSIPKELSQMTQLEDLKLHLNKLTGTLPSELGLLGTLREYE